MARETWTADGFLLTDGWVRDVELRDGLYQTPNLRGSNLAVAGRHGAPPTSRKWDVGGFTLNLWYGDTSRDLVEQRYEEILRACVRAERLVLFVRTLADGTQRQCYGRVTQAIQPSHMGQLGGRIALQVEIPGAYWQDVQVTTDSITGIASPLALPLTSKARSSAPLTDLVYTITGPINNPTVQVTSDASITDSFTWLGAVAVGQGLVVDAGLWQVSGTGGLSPGLDVMRWTGDRFLTVPHAVPGSVPTVSLSGTGQSAATRLDVAGRAAYLQG